MPAAMAVATAAATAMILILCSAVVTIAGSGEEGAYVRHSILLDSKPLRHLTRVQMTRAPQVRRVRLN